MNDELSPQQAIKAPCRVATTGNISLSGFPAVDGVTVVAGDRVLVKAQSNNLQNGIYEVTSSGGWARAADFDDSDDAVGGTLVAVVSGTMNGKSLFQLAGFGSLAPGTDPILFNLRPSPLTPEDFGAKGDGVSDDYDALKALADTVSARGGGQVLFGRGKTYRIDRVRIYGPNPNPATDIFIQWTDCRGLEIDLNGSKIDVKGNFHRAANGSGNSYSNSIIPFYIVGGSDIVLRNGEVDQNVDQMTRDENVGEGFATAITLAGCSRVLVENIYTHHGSTDGIEVTMDVRTAPAKVCRNVVLRNVVSRYNARLGLGLIGCVGFVADNCDFSYTGKAAGSYGHHAPAAGVDIEPDYLEGTGQTNVDAKTRGISFRNCSFNETIGFAFVASNPDTTADVTLSNCTASNSAATAVAFLTEHFTIEGGDFFNVGIWPAYGTTDAQSQRMSGHCTGARIRGNRDDFTAILIAAEKGPYFTFANNRFSFEATTPSSLMAVSNYQNWLQGANLRFLSNDIFVAKELYAGNASSNAFFAVAFCQLSGNRWRTDLVDPGKLFGVQINEAQPGEALLAGERFIGRVGPHSVFSVNFGTQTFGVGRIRPGGYEGRDITCAPAAPTTGGWSRGDVVFNNIAAASGKVGWVCTVSGSPGTWKAFGAIDA
jgi:hypothetical protein